MKKGLLFLMILSLLLTSGCTELKLSDDPKDNLVQTQPVVTPVDDKMFTDRDQATQYMEEECVLIQLKGDTASASSDSVIIDGGCVTITGDKTYLLSGMLTNGSIVVDAGEKAKPRLIFQGINVTSNSAAFEIREADKVFVTLAEGTENVLSGGDEAETVDGAVFSKQDLTFNGAGALTVTSTSGHGMVCKDDLVFTGGQYQINSAAHGLDVNDSVRVTGDTMMTLNSGKDGIHCENSEDQTKGFVYIEKGKLKITSEGDGISAGGYFHIVDGSFDIIAGGGSVNGSKEQSDFFGGFMGGGRPSRPNTAQSTATEDSTSMKGLKAAGEILIAGGNFVMDTADDCIHSNTTITVENGSFELRSGDDAFHADETLTIKEGLLNVQTSYEGLEAHKIHIMGGSLELHAKDDGINAAGGQDASGTEGGRDGMFGGPQKRPSGPMGGGASDGVIDISGGQLKIYASGDGLDANGSITISGGSTYVTNPSAGDTSVLDADTGAQITGGVFIGAGATTMMAQSFSSNSTQGVIACTVGSQPVGTAIRVVDESGNMLISYETEYNCVLVLLSTPELQKGETYTLTVGEYSGPVQAA